MIFSETWVPLERHQQILNLALAQRTIRIKDLAGQLGVHEMTVRRDVDALVEQGLLERIHGGARLAQKASEEVSQVLRASQHATEKQSLARAALAFVQQGDTVAVDASTTALALVRLLAGFEVKVLATGLDAANTLAASGVPFTLAAGEFQPAARSFVGPLVMDILRRVHPDTTFFSAKGFTPQSGFTDPYLAEVETKEQLIASSRQVVALLDHSKFGRTALYTIAEPERVDVLITDREPSSEMRVALETAGVHLVVTEEGSAVEGTSAR